MGRQLGDRESLSFTSVSCYPVRLYPVRLYPVRLYPVSFYQWVDSVVSTCQGHPGGGRVP